MGQGKCVTRPSLTQGQWEETRPKTRTLCIYDTVTLTLTRPSHHARTVTLTLTRPSHHARA